MAGENDEDMILAVDELKRIGGGIVVAMDGKILASLALPYGGLMTDRSVVEISDILMRLHEIVKNNNGVTISDPFMTLSFISLAVCPALKLTVNGLVDVNKFKLVDLFK